MISSYFYPNYTAEQGCKLLYSPRKLDIRQFEKDIMKNLEYKTISVPTKSYVDNYKSYLKSEIAKPELPETIQLMEFMPKSIKRNYTVLCCHGWEGRGTNFCKFIQPLLDNGIKVLCIDFPMHGNTEGYNNECGVHINSHAINCVVSYFETTKFVILAHSLGNSSNCVTFYTANEKILNRIIGFCAIGIGDSYYDFFVNFCNMIGLTHYSYDRFVQLNSEIIGFDISKFGNHNGIEKVNIPIFIIHDENDKELPIAEAISNSKACINQNVMINNVKVPCLHITKGLGHRRIIRDDGVVKLAVDFLTNCDDFKNV